MKKRLRRIAMIFFCLAVLSGCGQNPRTDEEAASKATPESVRLTVWGSQEDKELVRQMVDGFEKYYQGQANFHITFAEQGESQCKDALLADLENGADVFTFADDQLNALAAAGALEPVETEEELKKEHLPAAVEAASVGDTLYAYPLTADNGYFLYYNKRYFTEADIRTLDGILEAASRNGRQFAMDWSSAWYVYAFFGGAGLDVGLNPDGITNFCAWNQTDGDIRGVDVAQAMLDIAESPAFADRDDAGFLEGVRDGSIAAGVSGVWNAVTLEKIWGEDFGAAKLPTYTCGGKQVQMASFSGCKLIGANAYSEHYDWAVKLAQWMTSESSQKLRFEMRGQGPSNQKVAELPEVQQSAAIAALLEQSEFSKAQRVGGKLWDPVMTFAENMAAGNPSGENLQDQLDEMVEGVTAR